MEKSIRKADPVKTPPESQVQTSVQLIRSWLQKQPHLPPTITDDVIVLFLHASRYRTERAKSVIDAYFSLRSGTDIFIDRMLTSNKFKESFETVCFFDLPETTPQGERVIIFRYIDPTVSKYDYVNCTRYCFAMFDCIVHRNQRVPGYHIIYDLEGAALGHILKCAAHMTSVKKQSELSAEGLPVVLTGIHLINASSILEPLMTFIKPLLNSELLNLITTYTPETLHKLYEIIPQKMLPKELGGSSVSYLEHLERAKEELQQNQEYIASLEKMTVDESKRQNKSKFANDIFGLQGSFKNISLD